MLGFTKQKTGPWNQDVCELLGSVAHPIAWFNPTKVKEILKIPTDYTLITLIIVARAGDPADLSEDHRAIELGERDRKPLGTVY